MKYKLKYVDGHYSRKKTIATEIGSILHKGLLTLLKGTAMLNKILEVFTREYKKETEYQEFIETVRNKFKLNYGMEDVEKGIELFKDKNVTTNFKISIWM